MPRRCAACWPPTTAARAATRLYSAKPTWGEDSLPAGQLSVRELVAADAETELALWSDLLSRDLITEVRAAARPLDDPLLQWLGGPRRARARLMDGLWARLIDVPAALRQRRYACDVDVVIEVADAELPANCGRWRLTAAAGEQASCEPTTAAADLTATAQALGAAYLGGTGLASLAAAGQVTASRPAALADADGGDVRRSRAVVPDGVLTAGRPAYGRGSMKITVDAAMRARDVSRPALGDAAGDATRDATGAPAERATTARDQVPPAVPAAGARAAGPAAARHDRARHCRRARPVTPGPAVVAGPDVAAGPDAAPGPAGTPAWSSRPPGRQRAAPGTPVRPQDPALALRTGASARADGRAAAPAGAEASLADRRPRANRGGNGQSAGGRQASGDRRPGTPSGTVARGQDPVGPDPDGPGRAAPGSQQADGAPGQRSGRPRPGPPGRRAAAQASGRREAAARRRSRRRRLSSQARCRSGRMHRQAGSRPDAPEQAGPAGQGSGGSSPDSS